MMCSFWWWWWRWCCLPNASKCLLLEVLLPMVRQHKSPVNSTNANIYLAENCMQTCNFSARYFHGRIAAAAGAAEVETEVVRTVAEKDKYETININIKSSLKCYHIDLRGNDHGSWSVSAACVGARMWHEYLSKCSTSSTKFNKNNK